MRDFCFFSRISHQHHLQNITRFFVCQIKCKISVKKTRKSAEKPLFIRKNYIFLLEKIKKKDGEKEWKMRMENREMEKKGMEKCGWTAGEMFSII